MRADAMMSRDLRVAITDLIQLRQQSDLQATLLLIELATQYLGRVRAGRDSNARVNAASALNEAYFRLNGEV